MKSWASLLGWLCLAAGFVLTILLVFGVFDPLLDPVGLAWPPLVGLLPRVSLGIALCALGVWLIAGGTRR
ncbi:hypothetical protein [Vulcaniibacterium tengchongense]|uniref:Uncharacterized protein n=1 Tax=Vulcaniibacterium tengchongense TaxID=1273429 RepID=A0A3N4V9W5_9GAMM|nr:hypothetical protein [Vulcaniibacterium tengchongense]RPE79796.1 hypothetical protein EDC50_1622 [Vulcaniibacterium tengchongense]